MIDVVFSLDNTGSMHPCTVEARQKIAAACRQLFHDLPDLRIGFIAHGDYCDADKTYVTRQVHLTNGIETLANFIQKVPGTHGGDSDECYELVLNDARLGFEWRAGAQKVLVMVGDAEPHEPGYRYGPVTVTLDWRKEIAACLDEGLRLYAVQCLGRRGYFWTKLAEMAGTPKLALDQFSIITELIQAIVYKQAGDEQLQSYADSLTEGKLMNRGLAAIIAQLQGKDAKAAGDKLYGTSDLEAVLPGRFQVLTVDRKCDIRTFVEESGAAFKKGRGFYQFTKTESIQAHKEVVLVRRDSGDMFTGKKARELLGLPDYGTVRIKPAHLDEYDVFVQSTSYNRKLVGTPERPTKFLYEVE